MTANVVAVPPDTTVRSVCALMREHEIGAVPIVDAVRRVLGLVTDRDVVTRAVAARRDIDRVHAGDIMSVGIECAAPDTPVTGIAEKMARYRVRRIPIVDDGEHLVGIVSRDDLV
ncbi:MAG TPA: CBS domain-containing protein [Polyangia bacterium]|nr:CBS domain-containing protein [Polyangia bacterium]